MSAPAQSDQPRTAPRRTSSWGGLDLATRCIFISLIGAGAVVALYCLTRVPSLQLDGQLLLLGLMAIVTGSIAIKLPFLSARVSLDTVFVFALVIVGADEIAVLVSALAMVVGDLGGASRDKPWHTLPFNFATGVLSAFVAVLAAGLAVKLSPDLKVVSQVVALSVGYFAVNIAMVGIAMSRIRSVPLHKVLKKLVWTFPAFLGAGCIAAILCMTLAVAPTLGLLLTPLVVIIYAALQAHRSRIEEAKAHDEAIEELFFPTVSAIAAAIEARDAADGDHHSRVQTLSLALAQEVGLDDPIMVRAIRFGALLHDVGRIALPDSILLKKGPLTADERAQVELHPSLGADLIRHIPFQAPVAETIRHHHEQWDGGGYPDGLKGEAIPLTARIVAIAEAMDTMTSERTYARAQLAGDALKEMESCSATRFDPALVAALPKALESLGLLETEVGKNDSESALSAIKRGAQAQALSLNLGSELSHAKSFAEALEVVARVTKDVMQSDGWAIVEVSADGSCASCAQVGLDLVSENLADDPVEWAMSVGCDLTRMESGSWGGFLMSRCLQATASRRKSILQAITGPLAETCQRLGQVAQQERIANTDVLTGLSNRLALDRAFMEAKARADHLVVLLLDLDGFKGINDHFGHQAGDVALVDVGAALLQLERQLGFRAFRQGGDEFVVLSTHAKLAPSDLSERIQSHIERIELDLGGGEYLRVKTSIGIAAGDLHEATTEALVEKADHDMYEKKQARPDRLPRGSRPVTYRRAAAAQKPAGEAA